MRRTALTLTATALVLSACTSGEMASTGQLVQRPVSGQAAIGVTQNGVQTVGVASSMVLPQTGQGNSGGVLAMAGDAPVAGVEATMRFNGSSRSVGPRVDFHNGPLASTGVICARAGGGATVPACDKYGVEEAFLVSEVVGQHSYTGAFAVNGIGANKRNGFVAIHAGHDDKAPILPTETARYTGTFQGGAALDDRGLSFAGRASGTATLEANFAAGTIDGTFNGSLTDDRSRVSTPLTAGFEGAAINANGQFFNTSLTTFTYSGLSATGELDGAFYGPAANEAAGAFAFGNSKGGITGVMVGCHESSTTNCLRIIRQ
ncbi:MAG: transferrin-binding protein-like solute binding protein [Roseinatronobacter sp.]